MEPFPPNIKVDDEDEPIFEVTETKFDPTQISWNDAPVKQEEIVVVSIRVIISLGIYLKEMQESIRETGWLIQNYLRYKRKGLLTRL